MTDDPACPPLVLSGPPTGTAPLELGGRVTLYVCGITPYDAAHVGHAFTYSAFDTLTRFLRSRGHEVIYCRTSPTWTTTCWRAPPAPARTTSSWGAARRPPTCTTWTR